MLKKIQELRKELVNPDLKTALTLILDGAQKLAKSDKNRPMTEEDISTSAFNFKKLLSEEQEYAKLKVDYDATNYESQFELVNMFLQTPFNDEQVKGIIENLFAEKYSVKDKKTMGLLIKDTKEFTKNRFEEKRVSALVKEFIEE